MGFVLLALAVLVAVPPSIQRRLVPYREEAERFDEARTLVTRVQFGLARQMSLLQGALLAPDSTLPSLYVEALESERSAYPQLTALAAPLSATAVRLQALSAEWHARLNEELVFAGGSPARAQVLRRDLSLYERALDAARSLDSALADAARDRRERVAEANAKARTLTMAMAILAFLSAMAVGWFAQRVRKLAAEAAARREEAEVTVVEIQRVSESRARLMRGITHDVKNPLGAADGYAELLEMGIEGELTAGQAKMVAGIRRSIGSGLGMIKSLLDFSRAESGQLELVFESVDCRSIVAEAVEQYCGSARAAGQELELVLPENTLMASTDRARAGEIVGNLLSNAIKYTPAPGRIVVTASEAHGGGAVGSARWVELRVSDSGPGIPPSERERIFDEFHRLGGNEAQGHGLGLATCRRVADALGGRLTVADVHGGGAAFSLWLPVDT